MEPFENPNVETCNDKLRLNFIEGWTLFEELSLSYEKFSYKMILLDVDLIYVRVYGSHTCGSHICERNVSQDCIMRYLFKSQGISKQHF